MAAAAPDLHMRAHRAAAAARARLQDKETRSEVRGRLGMVRAVRAYCGRQ
jgi:hypothetical protein